LNHENQATSASSCDAELIQRAQKGEEQAFEAIFHAHKRKIYYLCLRMIGNAAEAEELTQEAFMQVFRKLQTFRGESSFATWLHRVSVNVVLMRLRKKLPVETPIDTPEESETSGRPPKEFGAPDATLTGLVERVWLDRAVAKLPKGCRQVFLLHDVLGCEHNEIAAMLDYSVGNSKSQLHKARMRLRKLLGIAASKNSAPKKSSRIARFAQSLRDSNPGCNGCPAT
jgi:RNA polymerase sigma-70 factor, ECF subfamily